VTDSSQLPSLPTDNDSPILDEATGIVLGFVIKELTRIAAAITKARLADTTGAALGEAAVGAALYAAAEIFTGLLSSMVNETLDEVGDAHFRTARDAFQSAQQEPSAEGRLRQFTVAETALRTAYEFYRTVADRSPGLASTRRMQIVACGKAAEAALCVATINQLLAANTTAATWAERAQAQFDRYVGLSHQAAKNGIWMNRVSEVGARVGQGMAPAAGLAGGALLLARGRPRSAYLAVRGVPGSVRGLGEAAEAANRRRTWHHGRPDRLAQEQQTFQELYAKLVPDSGRP
jgi:hypothetical protein